MQTVWVRVEAEVANGGNGCFAVVPLELIVSDSPGAPPTVDPLIACGEDGNMVATFDLTQQTPVILDGLDGDGYTVTYHLQQSDAEAGTPLIAAPTMFQNTMGNPQTVWYRVDTNGNDNFCNNIGSFEVEVVDGPEIFDPVPFTQCGDLDDNGVPTAVFNLTLKNDEITGGAAGLNVQYFETQADATANTAPITGVQTYTNTSNPQIIFVRVIDSNSGCVGFTTLELRVEPNPQVEGPFQLEACDYTDPTDDGIESFNLTLISDEILGGAPWDLGYYETEQDAIDQVDGIPDPTDYENEDSNPQTVYIRVTNNNTTSACFTVVELQLIVNPLPDDTAVVENLIICEVPDDGLAEFDLTEKIDELLGEGQDAADYTVTFYETQADAEVQGGMNPIDPDTSYPADTSAGNITIWVGIENNGTGCYIGGTLSFELETREGATATSPMDVYTVCDAEGDNDGSTSFDLTLPDLIAEILGPDQDTANFPVTFHETFENADTGTDPVGGSYTNIINPQTLYIRVTNDATECYATAEITLNVEQLPQFSLEESYRLCVDENGNPIQSDFGEASPPELLIGLDPQFYTFEWTLNDVVLEGENGNGIIAVQGGTYTVTATEIATGCSAIATTEVTVSSPPTDFSARLVNGAFSNNNIVEVLNGGEGDYEYSIDGGPFQESNLFENVLPGAHDITIRDANGCGEVTFPFGVVDFEEFMTPNGDGFHDEWRIIAIEEFDPTAKIYIFDRYGKLLKQLSPINDTGWDGNYNGNPMPSSDYWFLVEYTEDDTQKQFRSHFTLKR